MTTANDFVIRSVSGRAIPLGGDDIDTDRIMPARYLRCVTFDGLEKHVFEDDRQQTGGKHPFDNPAYRGASILIAGRNFGCGSSREHAPQGLARWGIHGIVAVSFAEIFFGNCVSLGVPCVTVSSEDAVKLQKLIAESPQSSVRLDLEARTVTVSIEGRAAVSVPAAIPDGVRQGFLGGTWDATGLLLKGPEDVRRVAQSLGYTRAFA